MSFGERIKNARKAKGLTQQEVADQLKVSGQSVQQWETDATQPRAKRLEKLCEVLGITAASLQSNSDQDTSELKNPASINFKQQDHYKTVDIPFITEAENPESPGETIVVENHNKMFTMPCEILEQARVSSENAACVRVSGISMLPMLNDGSFVGIDVSEKIVRDGTLYALDHGGMLWVKLLFRLPGGGLRVRSINNTDFPDEDYDQRYCSEYIKILGKAFWHSSII